MKYYNYSVSLLKDRMTANPNELQDPAKDYEILKALGVKDFDRDILNQKPGFRTVQDLGTSFRTLKDMLYFFGYLKRKDVHNSRFRDEKDYGVSYSFDSDTYLPKCSEISLTNEQPVFLLSKWVEACLTLNKRYINDDFEYNVLKPLKEALATKPEDVDKITEPDDASYTDPRGKLFRALKAIDERYLDYINNQIYNVMIPIIKRDGLINFILNINPKLYSEDNLYSDNLYTQAVLTSIFMCVDENLDLFTKMVLTNFLSSRIDMFRFPNDNIPKEREYVALDRCIRDSFFLDKYYTSSVPIYEDFRLFTGYYGDFLILLGYLK